jgi:hypothetical protein
MDLKSDITGGEHKAVFLRKGREVKVVPLPVSSHPFERHPAGAIQ